MYSKSHALHEAAEVMEKDSSMHIEVVVHAAHLYQEDSDGRVVERLLLPRPTDDPLDPLTWKAWRKFLALATVSYFLFLSYYVTSSITPILVNVVAAFDINFTKASYLITFNVLFTGIGNLFWVPLALKIGKRPVLILSTATFWASNAWSAVAQSYESLLAARIVQGFGSSACEALGPAIVADLFFLHERGLWVGVCTFMIGLGNCLGGIFAGQIINANPNWRWVFWMNTILTGVCFLLTLLFQPETNFKRPEQNESGEGLDISHLKAIRGRANSSWVRSLSVTGWYDRETSIWYLYVRPWKTLQYPAVVWGSTLVGVSVGWLVAQQTANAGAFPALYNFSGLAVGNIAIGYIITAIIGCAVGGPICDWIAASISKRHGGYFKPEYRLWALSIPALFAPIGLMMWGGGLQNHKSPYIGIVGSSITNGIVSAVAATTVVYCVDNYRPIAGEVVTMFITIKEVIAFGLSFGIYPWFNHDGPLKMSGWMLLIEGVVFLCTIPMYIYGPRFRRWTGGVEM